MLTTLDLSGMSNVTAIGDDFLRGCTGLRTVDLSGLSKVATIGLSAVTGVGPVFVWLQEKVAKECPRCRGPPDTDSDTDAS